MEELSAPEGSKIVNLFHYAKDPSRTHGVPCKFVILEVGHRDLKGRVLLISTE